MGLISHGRSGSVASGLSLFSVTGLVVSDGPSVVMLLLSKSDSVVRDLVDRVLAHYVELLAGVLEISKEKLSSSWRHVGSTDHPNQSLEEKE